MSRNKRYAGGRCKGTGKTMFSTFDAARHCAARFDVEARIYNCPTCGRWHLTSNDKSTWDRTQAQRQRGAS